MVEQKSDIPKIDYDTFRDEIEAKYALVYAKYAAKGITSPDDILAALVNENSQKLDDILDYLKQYHDKHKSQK